MLLADKLWRTVSIFMIVLTITLGIQLISGKLSKRLGHWKDAPNVVLCSDAPVNLHQVQSATSWWEARGYKFGAIYQDDCPQTLACKTLTISCYPAGIIFITFGNSDVMGNALGRTKSRRTLSKIIYSSVILLPDDVHERVLEHELGHALGWNHFPQDGHIMHRYLSNGGWGDQGLIVR